MRQGWWPRRRRHRFQGGIRRWKHLATIPACPWTRAWRLQSMRCAQIAPPPAPLPEPHPSLALSTLRRAQPILGRGRSGGRKSLQGDPAWTLVRTVHYNNHNAPSLKEILSMPEVNSALGQLDEGGGGYSNAGSHLHARARSTHARTLHALATVHGYCLSSPPRHRLSPRHSPAPACRRAHNSQGTSLPRPAPSPLF